MVFALSISGLKMKAANGKMIMIDPFPPIYNKYQQHHIRNSLLHWLLLIYKTLTIIRITIDFDLDLLLLIILLSRDLREHPAVCPEESTYGTKENQMPASILSFIPPHPAATVRMDATDQQPTQKREMLVIRSQSPALLFYYYYRILL